MQCTHEHVVAPLFKLMPRHLFATEGVCRAYGLKPHGIAGHHRISRHQLSLQQIKALQKR